MRLLGRRMFEDFSERLFAHFVAGHWRAPFGDETHAVLSHQGALLGQVVAAGPDDIARAMAVRRGADRQACQRLANAIEVAAGGLAQAYALQSGHLPEAAAFARMAAALESPLHVGAGGLFTAPDTRFEELGRALGAGIVGGVIWCPPVEGAVFATALACLVQQADLPPGAFALLHSRVASTESALRATSLRFQEC